MNSPKTIFVAMSGGVDSSVVAGLMKEQGHNVVGVTMCFNITHPNNKKPSCCGVEGIEDARRAAQILDIPHYVFNYAQDLKENIIDDFTSEYLNGRTPNPCVRCNQHLKFGSLFEKVRRLGADYLATGHYAKIHYNDQNGRYELKKARDTRKDQSYFLYSVRKETLPYVLFPIGNMTKEEVRQLGTKYNLANAQKPESQDICFVSADGYKKFLEDRVGKGMMVPGPFKDETDDILGQHKGIGYYTIGQRDGLGVALGRPTYVYKIDKETNTIYLGDLQRLFSKGLIASQMNYISSDPPLKDFKVEIRLRHGFPEVTAFVTSLDHACAEIRFVEPQKSVTPGQSVVLYRDDVVLAGGIIEKAIA